MDTRFRHTEDGAPSCNLKQGKHNNSYEKLALSKDLKEVRDLVINLFGRKSVLKKRTASTNQEHAYTISMLVK
jgi:hypothetical protein